MGQVKVRLAGWGGGGGVHWAVRNDSSVRGGRNEPMAKEKGHVGVAVVCVVECAHANVEPQAAIAHCNALEVEFRGVARGIAQHHLLRKRGHVAAGCVQ